jgi:hypothetical protein
MTNKSPQGKVPKNGFGNIDLFTAEMLPNGAAHIPSKKFIIYI